MKLAKLELGIIMCIVLKSKCQIQIRYENLIFSEIAKFLCQVMVYMYYGYMLYV